MYDSPGLALGLLFVFTVIFLVLGYLSLKIHDIIRL